MVKSVLPEIRVKLAICRSLDPDVEYLNLPRSLLAGRQSSVGVDGDQRGRGGGS